MSDDPDLDRAYALQTPDDSRRLYADWADSYDTGFALENRYVLHEEVARHYALIGGFGPVMDVGTGTGLCGVALHGRGIRPVDGIDISPEMLAQAQAKGVYRELLQGNLLDGLPPPPRPYQGAVSSGTFTSGHVGPEGIDPILETVCARGWIVISVNAQHYVSAGFAAKIDALAPQITDYAQLEVNIYAADATGPHASDTALLLSFRKA